MALRTLGTTTTTALRCLSSWQPSLSQADIAAIAMTITDDAHLATVGGLAGVGALGPTGILATGSTHTNTTLDTLVLASGSPLSSIGIGWLVIAADIPPGTFVTAKPTATSVTLSQAATGSNAGERVIFKGPSVVPHINNGVLAVPRRGILKLMPNDIVAIDNTGAVIVVPGSAIAYGSSQWVLT